MSIRVMSQVWKNGPESPVDRLMMLAIADNANDEGLAWPSRRTLAVKCCIDERSVKRVIRRLEEQEWISTTRGGGHRDGFGIPNRYQINMEKVGDPGSPTPYQSRGTEEALWGTLSATLGDRETPLTIKNHHLEPKSRASAQDRQDKVTEALDQVDGILSELKANGIFDKDFTEAQRIQVRQMRQGFKKNPRIGGSILSRCEDFMSRLREHGIIEESA